MAAETVGRKMLAVAELAVGRLGRADTGGAGSDHAGDPVGIDPTLELFYRGQKVVLEAVPVRPGDCCGSRILSADRRIAPTRHH